MLDKSGSLTIRTFTAGGALPIEGAVVRIFGGEDENKSTVYSLITDSDGVTERIPLPAPNKSLSENPESIILPYAIYNIEVEKDGYFTKKLYNIPVFDGINSVQPIDMIPYSPIPENYPSGNINTYTEKNEIQ